MSLFNITEYRRAKAVVKELDKALKLLNAAEASLKNYAKYRPIYNILTTIGNEKPFLEIYLEQNKIILETKGLRRK